jgi:hypothetical protein
MKKKFLWEPWTEDSNEKSLIVAISNNNSKIEGYIALPLLIDSHIKACIDFDPPKTKE